jgi:hypothetical protein
MKVALVVLLALVAVTLAQRGGGTASISASQKAANARVVRGILLAKFPKFGQSGVSAMMGNIETETGTFDFRTRQQPRGPGYGLFQYDFMKSYYLRWLGKRTDSADLQLTWAQRIIYTDMSILGGGAAGRLRKIMESSASVAEKTRQFCLIFEKPSVPHMDRRLRAAAADFAANGRR